MPPQANVEIHYGPYESCGIVEHSTSRLEGLQGKWALLNMNVTLWSQWGVILFPLKIYVCVCASVSVCVYIHVCPSVCEQNSQDARMSTPFLQNGCLIHWLKPYWNWRPWIKGHGDVIPIFSTSQFSVRFTTIYLIFKTCKVKVKGHRHGAKCVWVLWMLLGFTQFHKYGCTITDFVYCVLAAAFCRFLILIAWSKPFPLTD